MIDIKRVIVMKSGKTNVLRLLDQAGIDYRVKEYEYDEDHLSGEHIVDQVDLDASQIYKTLVLRGTKGFLVCCIPVLDEIDLKLLAKASGNKSVEMIHQKELLPLTGYMRGGCSPIGMKKMFPTYFQEDMILFDEIAVSAGKRGLQVILSPQDLCDYVHGYYVDVVKRG